MVEEFVNVWKLFLMIFLVGLFLFLFYLLIENLLIRIEFKKNLSLTKEQVIFKLFNMNNIDTSGFRLINELLNFEIKINQELVELEKLVYQDILKYSFDDLKRRVNMSFFESNYKLNRLVLSKYREAIKSLNNKVIYLKSEIDNLKLALKNSKNFG